MTKQIKFGADAKAALLEGADLVTEAVASTLGPRGNNVAYQRPFGTPGVVHDGVTVAKEVQADDPFVNMSVELIKEAAQQTNDQAGDGTTTAIVLTHALLTEGLGLVAAHHNPMMLRKGIDAAVTALVGELKNLAKPVKTGDEILQVARISAQNEEIGDTISKAIEKLGKDVVITVEESNQPSITVEYKDGMEFDQGYLTPYFQTDAERGEAVINDANIVITDRSLSDIAELQGFFNNLQQTEVKNNLVIIANDITGSVLATLVLNKVNNGLNVLAVKAPSFGEKQKDILLDLAASTGAKVITSEAGQKLDNVNLVEFIGSARRVVSTKDNTTVVEGNGSDEDINSRIESIKRTLDNPQISEFDQERHQERLAKLTAGIAIINVGANSEAEQKELKERIIDAISATKAALEEGIVPGGETALIRVQHVLDGAKEGLSDEAKVGVDLVARAITAPFKRLMSNSGFDSGEKFAELKNTGNNFGVDVMDGEIKDLLKAGVVDPVKVTRSALQNAASTAVMMMTTNVLIVDKPVTEKQQ